MIKEAWMTNKAEVKARLDKDVKDKKLSKSYSKATLATLFPERRMKKPVRSSGVKKVKDGPKKSFQSSLRKEEAPVNNVGGGNIAGTGIGPDGEPGFTKKRQKDLVMMRRKTPQGLFAGKKTFKVPHKMFTEMRNARADKTWWKKTVGEDYIGEDIREFANANPREPVILEDEDYGWMHYLRYGKE
tara:strand:- start:20846 stop:21403 length:558 start_codon:yes stop_codon:yes gene_type:complete